MSAPIPTGLAQLAEQLFFSKMQVRNPHSVPVASLAAVYFFLSPFSLGAGLAALPPYLPDWFSGRTIIFMIEVGSIPTSGSSRLCWCGGS